MALRAVEPLPGRPRAAGAVEAVAGVTALALIQDLAVLGGRKVGHAAAGLEPVLEVALLMHDDFGVHRGVLGAAVLGAERLVGARLRRLEPQVGVAVRQDVVLYAKSRHEEAVDHVGAAHFELHRAVGRHVQLVGDRGAIGVSEAPVPLLPLYVDDVGVGRGRVDANERLKAPRKDDQNKNRRNDDPGHLQRLALFDRRGALAGVLAAVLVGEVEHRRHDAHEEHHARPVDEVEERVDLRGNRRGLLRKPDGRVVHGYYGVE